VITTDVRDAAAQFVSKDVAEQAPSISPALCGEPWRARGQF
jgi:hypothetical protein